MIITRTPFRISFFGGGTDYPVWFQEHPGSVISTAIDKFCYISCRYLPPFFTHKSRIVWSQIERVESNLDIEHPVVREVIKYMGLNDVGLEIHHDGDLPARSGLGSSSSFTVGILQALSLLKGGQFQKKELANAAIHIEKEILKENVGYQDQIAATFGGFNRINFFPDKDFEVLPIDLPNARIKELQKHLLLVYTGITRFASEVAGQQIKATPNKTSELKAIYSLVEEAVGILKSESDICEIGKLLHESWLIKRSITDGISNGKIDEVYEIARRKGAIGGKVLGAGGGGFVLLFAEPSHHSEIKAALNGLLHVPFVFEKQGCSIVFQSDTMSNI